MRQLPACFVVYLCQSSSVSLVSYACQSIAPPLRRHLDPDYLNCFHSTDESPWIMTPCRLLKPHVNYSFHTLKDLTYVENRRMCRFMSGQMALDLASVIRIVICELLAWG